MDLEELESALKKLDLEILEDENEIVLTSSNFNQNGILIINNKPDHKAKQIKEWSVE